MIAMPLGSNATHLSHLVSTRSLPPSSLAFAYTLAHLPQPSLAAILTHLLQSPPSQLPTA